VLPLWLSDAKPSCEKAGGPRAKNVFQFHFTVHLHRVGMIGAVANSCCKTKLLFPEMKAACERVLKIF
jgi:hypothetical protein